MSNDFDSHDPRMLAALHSFAQQMKPTLDHFVAHVAEQGFDHGLSVNITAPGCPLGLVIVYCPDPSRIPPMIERMANAIPHEKGIEVMLHIGPQDDPAPSVN